MGKSANHTLIGAFVISAALLAVLGAAFFGAMDFSQRAKFILYFNESVNGLEVGAPVKWRGVPIGRVTEIRIRYKQDDDSDVVPVFIEIDTDNLENELGVSQIDLNDANELRGQINLGLRAKLQTESIITGLLFVELYYETDPKPPILHMRADAVGEEKEIPTAPSLFQAIGQTASEALARLGQLDFHTINDSLIGALDSGGDVLQKVSAVTEKLDQAVAAFDYAGINASILETSAAYRDLAKSQEVLAAIEHVAEMLEEYKALATDVRGQVGPMADEVKLARQDVSDTLARLSAAATQLETAVRPESSLRYETEAALREIRVAAKRLSQFVDYLERNPRALLTGKPEDE